MRTRDDTLPLGNVPALPALPALGRLGDPSEFQGPIGTAGHSADTLLARWRTMLTIRRAEERIGRAVDERAIRCPAHLAIGQEAIPAAVGAQLRPTDRVFGAHRSHGHYLAQGASLHSLFAEALGRTTGGSRGMGGSMHLCSPQHGFGGSVPIVGATVPVAVGAALAAKMDGGDAIAVAYVGDGAFEEGVVHESLNLAAVMRLPVLFVAENNLFASHLHIRERQAADMLGRFAQANGVAVALVDGNDVAAMETQARALVARCRSERAPAMIEAVTYRQRGHVGPRDDLDVGLHRSHDLAAWKLRDPIERLSMTLVAHGFATSEALAGLADEVQREVDEAWSRALADPVPATERLLDTVYAA